MKKLLFLLPALLLACSAPEADLPDEEAGVQTVKKVVMYEAKNGFHTWVLEAGSADFFEDNERISLKTPEVVFKNNEREVSRIKGDRGTFSLAENTIVLEGNVQGKDVQENVSIKTALLNYDMLSKKIWTGRAFTLVRGGVTVYGQGFQANGDLTEIEIIKQTTKLPEDIKDI